MVEICKDIDQGLVALNRKIDEQNKTIKELERNLQKCCNPDKDRDIDQRLAAFNRKIDEQNKRLKELERNTKNPAPKNISLADVLRRITSIEKTQEALKIGIVESLNNFANIEDTSQDLIQAFKGLYEMVTPLIDSVSTVISFLGDSD